MLFSTASASLRRFSRQRTGNPKPETGNPKLVYNPQAMFIVMKFGGTSVGSVAALRQVIGIAQKARSRNDEIVIVVSAMNGVTDLLLSSARRAEAGDADAAPRAHQEMLSRHTAVIEALVEGSGRREQVLAEINGLLNEFDTLCHSIRVLGELTPRALDVIAGMGERMSARQVAAVLDHHGMPSQSMDATQLVVTDNCYGSASPLMHLTAERCRSLISPLLAKGLIPVVTGFIGATEAGIPTTLGRGASDYSAAILAQALNAGEVWIWTDVNGVMTADPRLVPDAHTIPCLSYSEVGEMAYFGAKVLHPQAMRPARQIDIPIRILNTFEPDHSGTLISRNSELSDAAVKAITAIKDLSLITVEGAGMIGVPGVAARTFGAVAHTGANVLMISQSSSEQSICFVVPMRESAQVLAALEKEMIRELERRNIERIWSQNDIVIVAVVGAGMKGIPGISARIFGALGRRHINVIAIAQGSSEYNISLVIARSDADDAVRSIHDEFGLSNKSS
jgi:bifunctional aspartokinase / homoserine dehydrogenase 1